MKSPRALGPDPFGRVDPVAVAAVTLSLETREGRIVAAARIADELLDSGDPNHMWFGSAMKAWLEAEDAHVGDFERRFLRIAGAQGCTTSPAKVLRRIRRRG